MVVPTMGTVIMCFLPSTTPLRMASGTSPALPRPAPTRPLPSPTTTRALKEKRRPPLTTLATRLRETIFSWNSLPRSSRRSMRIPMSELQPALAGCLGERLDAAMEEIPGAIEHDRVHAGGLGSLRDRLADRRGAGGGACACAAEGSTERGLGRRRGNQRPPGGVVDELRADVTKAAEYSKARTR